MPDAAEAPPPPTGLPAMVAPGRTALVVIDVQVDFAAPHGLVGRSGGDLSTIEPAVDRIEALVAAARGAGIPIAFLRVMTRPETDTAALRTLMARRGTPGDEAICRVGDAGSAYHRVVPRPGDIEVEKLAYSGFHGTDLDTRLRARGVDTLVLAGLTTDCCVDTTARDAFQRDYHVFVVPDACATYDDGLQRAALRAMELHCALLADSRAVIGAWTPAWGDGRC